ncbi:MAG: biopolymer transporter ExbD [Stagnimonas sp.]|nr:biopolymer transporter ExbD [Stagnimonas sp.]
MRLGPARRPRARISLIPLIDVMLVLLFFFMLVTRYVEVGRTRLELAPAGRAGAGGSERSVQAQVLDGGLLRYGGETGPLPELLPLLKALPAGSELSLAPAPGVSLQVLIAVWEQLQAEGIRSQLAAGAP